MIGLLLTKYGDRTLVNFNELPKMKYLVAIKMNEAAFYEDRTVGYKWLDWEFTSEKPILTGRLRNFKIKIGLDEYNFHNCTIINEDNKYKIKIGDLKINEEFF